MTWLKIDDGFHDHRKTEDLTMGAVGLWTFAASWCSRNLTDGYLSARRVELLRGTLEQASELVAAGLWDEEDDGYRFHDWHSYQPTRDDVIAKREAWKSRQTKHRAKVAEEQESGETVTGGVTRDKRVSHAPVTESRSRPVPVPVPVSAQECAPNAHAHAQPDAHPKVRTPNAHAQKCAPDAFEEFWNVYPRKQDRKRARAAWTKASTRHPPDLIVAAAIAYRDDPNREQRFTKHAATWLNGDCWLDEPQPAQADSRQRAGTITHAVTAATQLADYLGVAQ